MSINFDTMSKTLIPAIGVVASVVLKNGGSQFASKTGIPLNETIMTGGKILFVLSWFGVAYALTNGDISTDKNKLIIGASAAIVISVMSMMKGKMMPIQPSWMKIAAMAFVVGWLALGYGTGMGKGGFAINLGLTAGACAVVSMMKVLPWQRMNGVVDGPGMPLFMLAWFGLAVVSGL
jgi:hypothetical protein